MRLRDANPPPVVRPREPRRATRSHDLTSALGVRLLCRPRLGQLGTLSLPHWAGSSTMALGPGCCGFIGPVPSATLDKCRCRAATEIIPREIVFSPNSNTDSYTGEHRNY